MSSTRRRSRRVPSPATVTSTAQPLWSDTPMIAASIDTAVLLLRAAVIRCFSGAQISKRCPGHGRLHGSVPYSKTASGVEQFVSKNDLHLTIGALNSRTEYERLSFPSKAGRGRHALLRADDFVTVCLQLEFVLHRIGLAFKYGLVSKCRVMVLDSHVTALDRGSSGAESTCLSIHGPFAGKVRLSLGKP